MPAGGDRLPTEAEAAKLLGALGPTPDTTVVVYDDTGGLHASRLFFVLEVFGHTRVVSAEWVRDRLGTSGFALVDARTADEFSGRDVRAKRGGHIPGAVNVEWTRNLGADMHFKPRDELRAMYARAGVTPDTLVVTDCQTHHRAAHSYFVLRLLGFPRLVGYDRSWIEWGNREDLPVARD